MKIQYERSESIHRVSNTIETETLVFLVSRRDRPRARPTNQPVYPVKRVSLPKKKRFDRFCYTLAAHSGEETRRLAGEEAHRRRSEPRTHASSSRARRAIRYKGARLREVGPSGPVEVLIIVPPSLLLLLHPSWNAVLSRGYFCPLAHVGQHRITLCSFIELFKAATRCDAT